MGKLLQSDVFEWLTSHARSLSFHICFSLLSVSQALAVYETIRTKNAPAASAVSTAGVAQPTSSVDAAEVDTHSMTPEEELFRAAENVVEERSQRR